MLMEGKMIRVAAVENGIYELVFDNTQDSVNKLNQATLLGHSGTLSASYLIIVYQSYCKNTFSEVVVYNTDA